MKLTLTAIRAMRFNKRDRNAQDIRWDSALTGFGVRVYPPTAREPDGRRAWVVRVKLDGRYKLRHFAEVEDMPDVDLAREKAFELIQAARRGNHYVINQTRARGFPLRELCTLYEQRHAPTLSVPARRENLRRLKRHVLRVFGDMQVQQITTADLTSFHTELTHNHGPVEANRVLQLMRTLFGLGVSWKALPRDFDNPAVGVRLNKEQPRRRVATPDELPRLVYQIALLPNPFTRTLFWLYLLQGTRKTELMHAQWSGWDRQRRTLLLTDTKSGMPLVCRLANFAADLVEKLHNEQRTPGHPYVFQGRKPGRPIRNPYKAWDRVRRHAGCRDVTIHDLRRTMGSHLVSMGERLQMVSTMLNHRDLQTTREAYAHLFDDSVRDTHDRWAAYVLGDHVTSAISGRDYEDPTPY